MRRKAEIIGVVTLVAVYGGLLVKQYVDFEQEYEEYCLNSGCSQEEERDTSSMCLLEESCLEYYRNITFADTARLLKEIREECEMVTNTNQAVVNCYKEIGVRMRIVELEDEKLNAVLPPNMQGDLKWNWLQRFLDVTVEYYDKLYGKDQWNYVLALDDTIRELKHWAESKRREYKNAMEAYHGVKSDEDCDEDFDGVSSD